MAVSEAILTQILAQLNALQVSQQTMQAKLDSLANEPASTPSTPHLGPKREPSGGLASSSARTPEVPSPISLKATLSSSAPEVTHHPIHTTDKERERLLYPGRINLTTYPDQHGNVPQPLRWGAQTASERGPVVCSRLPTSIKHRNAIGAHSGSYSIYRALSIAMGALSPTHKPDYSQTEPPLSIPPQPSWFDPAKIVSFDPWGHLVPTVFRKEAETLDIRPSIAVTKAHMKLTEIDDAAKRGDIPIDGKIVLKSQPLRNADGSISDAYL